GVREEQLREIAKIISSGENAVYAVLGDPSLYSTFGKIRKYVDRPVEYVPGVSALISCSLRAGVELAVGDMAVAIVPASRADLLKETLRLFDVVVVAKANRNIELLNELLSSHGGYAVRRCYMEGEAVSNRITWSDYFTTVYLWRAR
ncbi:MAG: cobalt-factor II C(20)-methyltransferase, partial [Pyrobaculum sp.]